MSGVSVIPFVVSEVRLPVGHRNADSGPDQAIPKFGLLAVHPAASQSHECHFHPKPPGGVPDPSPGSPGRAPDRAENRRRGPDPSTSRPRVEGTAWRWTDPRTSGTTAPLARTGWPTGRAGGTSSRGSPRRSPGGPEHRRTRDPPESGSGLRAVLGRLVLRAGAGPVPGPTAIRGPLQPRPATRPAQRRPPPTTRRSEPTDRSEARRAR